MGGAYNAAGTWNLGAPRRGHAEGELVDRQEMRWATAEIAGAGRPALLSALTAFMPGPDAEALCAACVEGMPVILVRGEYDVRECAIVQPVVITIVTEQYRHEGTVQGLTRVQLRKQGFRGIDVPHARSEKIRTLEIEGWDCEDATQTERRVVFACDQGVWIEVGPLVIRAAPGEATGRWQ